MPCCTFLALVSTTATLLLPSPPSSFLHRPQHLRHPPPHRTLCLKPTTTSTPPPPEQQERHPNQKTTMTDTNTESSSSSKSSWWWWWRKALGQRLNAAGVSWFASVVTKDRQLAVPHVSVPDVRWVDWEALEQAGFRGVVFDKDNTITAPYQLTLWPPLMESFGRCRGVFDGRVAVLSNSAGLYEYDPDGSQARAIEDSIQGVHVIRHGTKKPAGGTEEIEKYFGCSASHLIMVGDRYFTDIVYGNRNGFLTILTEPLSLPEEPLIVQQVRKCETYLVNSWCQKGIKPTNHSLLSCSEQFVRNPCL